MWLLHFDGWESGRDTYLSRLSEPDNMGMAELVENLLYESLAQEIRVSLFTFR